MVDVWLSIGEKGGPAAKSNQVKKQKHYYTRVCVRSDGNGREGGIPR